MHRHRHGTDTAWDWSEVVSWCQHEARRTIGRTPVAEDAAQEAALRAWRRRRQCRTPEDARGWVAAIARREALRAVARRPAEEPFELAREPAAEAAEGPGAELAWDVRSAVSKLDPDARRLVLLRYWMDLTQEEAARMLGIPEGTAKVRLHRVRHTLRAELAAA
jgi:RNA polymerase sigma-70 factor (ECF subfamily)